MGMEALGGGKAIEKVPRGIPAIEAKLLHGRMLQVLRVLVRVEPKDQGACHGRRRVAAFATKDRTFCSPVPGGTKLGVQEVGARKRGLPGAGQLILAIEQLCCGGPKCYRQVWGTTPC
ncbi:unnamed protein product, partial [Discosporangium mesarthrocarpum]